jgi:hypothetical protein
VEGPQLHGPVGDMVHASVIANGPMLVNGFVEEDG